MVLLLALFFFISIEVKAQTDSAKIESAPSSHDLDLRARLAGEELRIASRHYYTGLILIGAGTVVAISGAGRDPNPVLIFIGSVVSLIGSVYDLESVAHIGKAGRLLGGSTLSFGGTQSGGMGFALSF